LQLFRIYNVREPAAATKPNEVNRFIPAHLSNLAEKGIKAVHSYRNWWNETGIQQSKTAMPIYI
jgi:hypothetical protein